MSSNQGPEYPKETLRELLEGYAEFGAEVVGFALDDIKFAYYALENAIWNMCHPGAMKADRYDLGDVKQSNQEAPSIPEDSNE